jgi:hypothetical protein
VGGQTKLEKNSKENVEREMRPPLAPRRTWEASSISDGEHESAWKSLAFRVQVQKQEEKEQSVISDDS